MAISASQLAKITRPGQTVGQMEALAGIDSNYESRFNFWVECDREARRRTGASFASGEDCMAIARERCHAATAQRVEAGVLSLI
jgi:hypothetical protein